MVESLGTDKMNNNRLLKRLNCKYLSEYIRKGQTKMKNRSTHRVPIDDEMRRKKKKRNCELNERKEKRKKNQHRNE